MVTRKLRLQHRLDPFCHLDADSESVLLFFYLTCPARFSCSTLSSHLDTVSNRLAQPLYVSKDLLIDHGILALTTLFNSSAHAISRPSRYRKEIINPSRAVICVRA